MGAAILDDRRRNTMGAAILDDRRRNTMGAAILDDRRRNNMSTKYLKSHDHWYLVNIQNWIYLQRTYIAISPGYPKLSIHCNPSPSIWEKCNIE